VTVVATGRIVKALGSPYRDGEVVAAPTVDDGGAAHPYLHTELS
jgi:hypothetical protein